jgi:hypothetical protein
MVENPQLENLIILKDKSGFEIFIEGEESKESWYIRQYPGVTELFYISVKKDGKVVHEFPMFYSSLNVINLCDLYLKILSHPEGMIRLLFGKIVKINNIIIRKSDDYIEDFESCRFSVPYEIQGQKKTTINMWLSKTFLKYNCNKYLSQLSIPLLEGVKLSLIRVKEIKRVPEWQHYCGAQPRYWEIEMKDDGSIEFSGGTVWHAIIKGDLLYTDGCITRGMLLDVIDEGIRQASSLKCQGG